MQSFAREESETERQEGKWVSLRWIAGDLEVSDQTVRRLVKKGDMPGYKIGGEYRVLHEEYKAWLASRRVNSKDGRF